MEAIKKNILIFKIKLVFSLLIFCLLPMLGIGIYSYKQIQEKLISANLEHLNTILQMKQNQIETFMNTVNNDIDTICTSPYIIDVLIDKRDFSTQEYKKRLLLTSRQLEQFSQTRNIIDVNIIDGVGNTILCSKNTIEKESYKDTNLFEQAKIDRYTSDIVYDNSKNMFYVNIAKPILHNNQNVGVVLAQINIDNLFHLIQNYSGLGQSGETLIGKKFDNLIMFLNPLRHDPHAGLKRVVDVNGSIAIPIINGTSQIVGSGMSIDYRGESVLASWSYIPSLEWGIVAKIDTKEALYSLEIIKTSIITTAVILFVFSLFFSWYLAKRLANPVEKIHTQATHDFLTGLPNRFLLYRYIMEAMVYSHKNGTSLAVLFLDLDGFKIVNDTYGHNVGDELLKMVSQRLLSNIKISDAVSRLGGDEFVVLLYDVKNKDNVEEIAKRIKSVISEQYIINNQTINIGTSIGVSIYPNSALHYQDLIAQADKAMYEAKKAGKNNIKFACEL